MSDAFRIVSITLFSQEVLTRMPFRYGIATMTRLPHAFLQVEIEGKRGRSRGLAADHLPPKWFTKDPNAAIADEIATMRAVIVHAAEQVRGASFASAFAMWRELYDRQSRWATTQGHAPLLANFGTSMVERAVIDAVCRLEGISISQAIRLNRLGLALNEIDSSIPSDWLRLLPNEPLTEIVARHTVGLADEILETDLIAAGTAVNDGLPQSLEATVKAYGLREYKIKFGGQWEQDSSRLARIFACLNTHATGDWHYSLDGNESFPDATSFRTYWERLREMPWLRPHLGRLLFIEQPVSRVTALGAGADWRTWSDAPPITIDESDGALDDVPKSLLLGYAGSTHKNCKGVIKGILNRCRITLAASSGRKMLMSGEDLSNIGPVALLQDLAVQAVLGNRSVERNGHHYFRGLTMWPESVQSAVRRAHPDVYDEDRGFCALKINDGLIQLGTVNAAPFGYAAPLDPRSFCSHAEEIG